VYLNYRHSVLKWNYHGLKNTH